MAGEREGAEDRSCTLFSAITPTRGFLHSEQWKLSIGLAQCPGQGGPSCPPGFRPLPAKLGPTWLCVPYPKEGLFPFLLCVFPHPFYLSFGPRPAALKDHS